MVSVAPTGWTYTMKRISNCAVGDGLTVLRNPGTSAVRVVGLQTEIVGVPSRTWIHVAYAVRAVLGGSTPGEISASGPLTRLGDGATLAHAMGAVLQPFATSHRWYVIVAQLRITHDLRSPWGIRGLTVRFTSGGRPDRTFFPQRVTLARALSCSLSTATSTADPTT